MPQSSTSQSPETRLLETAEESRVYRRLHTAILKTTIKELIATSRLRATLAGLMSLVIWIALFFIMLEGFFFLQREAGAFTEETVEKVLNIFYASLMIMLFFSSAILIYGGIYQSQEIRFLITTPSSAARIFQYKFSDEIVKSEVIVKFKGFSQLSKLVTLRYCLCFEHVKKIFNFKKLQEENSFIKKCLLK